MTRYTVHRPVLRPRHLALALTAALLAPVVVVVVGPAAATARPTPVRTADVRVEPRRVPTHQLGGQLPAGTRAGAVTSAHPIADDIAVVGATWDDGALQQGDRLELRVRTDGVWQPWRQMEVDEADHAPDPGTAEGRASRAGTLPVVVESEQSQVRVLSTRESAPAVEVMFVDPGTSEADAEVGTRVPGSATAAASRPTILTRRDWGADETLRRGSPDYGQVQVGFVHHTAGTNTYTAEQVPGILRGIYDFHVNGRGWSDIGYQFLVDRFGRTWEGRYGGVDKAVVGAQAGGFNSGSFGASVMGDFSSAAVPTAVTTALTDLFAWKFTLHGIPATGRVAVSEVSFDRISGHRDANDTSCPGARLYDRLPALRTAVAARIGTRTPSALHRSVDAGGTADLLGRDAASPNGREAGRVLRAASPQPIRESVRVGTGWNVMRHVVLSPDVTGDGRPDILALPKGTTTLRVYAGNGRGGSSGMTERTGAWGSVTRLVASGDRTGDRRADLLAVRSDGALLLLEGDGAGWFRTPRVVATGFGAYRSVVDAGDITGDGLRDLLGVDATTGALEARPGTSGGGVLPAVRWGAGWAGLDQLASGGDLDADGHGGDLVVRQADGRMRTYYADEHGAMPRMNTWGRGWGAADQVSSGADWNGDGRNDVLARLSASGDLMVFHGTGQRDFSPTPLTVSTDLPDADLVRVVGDVDGDGLADGVARVTGGDLVALRGRGDGRFERVAGRVATAWQDVDLLEGVGDYTNDGVPDLLARTGDGTLSVYAMTRSFTVAWSLRVGSGWQGAVSVTGTGAVNGDVNADVVVLRADGSIRVYRGTGPGALNYYDTVLTGQDDLVRIVGTGDLTGDGPNDVVGVARDGSLYVYPGDGKGGFRPTRQPVRSS